MTIRFYLETYGCSLNMADSDIIIGRLNHMGYTQTENIAEADVIILNTCGVKEPTEDRIISRLETLSTQKTPVIVTGCLPRISLPRIKTAIPRFSAILGPQSIDSLGPVVERVLLGESGILHLETDTTSKLRYYENPSDSVVCTIPICEGCLGDCAYCAVKFARSEVKSYPIAEIVSVVRRSIHNGFKEIRLTAQDVAAYGNDTDESLIDLLNQVAQIEGNHRIRLGMFNPNLIMSKLDLFLDAMSSERFFRFFHIPLQSGSDHVLKKMNRYYSTQEWTEVVQSILSRFPRATIATDIIVGFPGETDDDFQLTLDILQKTRPSVINISKYGDRPGTLASKSTEKVLTQVKKNRSRQLSIFVEQLVMSTNKTWIGWNGPVIITDVAQPGQILGRTYTYKPVIIDASSILGSVPQVTITGAKRTHLIGKIIS